MKIETWLLFCAAVFALSGTPGPNMLHVLTRSVSFGFRRSVAAMMGCLTAVIAVLIASAAGLATILAAAPTLFEVLRYAGVAYLLYLGIKAWRAPAGDGPDTSGLTPTMSLFALFRGGFLISISNPKLLLFAAAFLPQFIDRSAPQVAQFVILVSSFAVIETFWYMVYGVGGRGIARYLTRPSLNRLFNRVCGAIFVSFGLALLGARSH